jgi:peroxiredoxin
MQHLKGMRLPDVNMRTSQHSVFNPCQFEGRAVYFCYPYTGRPGFANPLNWDTIKGAHGSTPQALEFSRLHKKFTALEIEVFGLSLLSEEWISDFAERNALPYLLLSDASLLEHAHTFTQFLNLPRFIAGQIEFLQRLTLICDRGVIEHVIYPVENPELNAAETLRVVGGK